MFSRIHTFFPRITNHNIDGGLVNNLRCFLLGIVGTLFVMRANVFEGQFRFATLLVILAADWTEFAEGFMFQLLVGEQEV